MIDPTILTVMTSAAVASLVSVAGHVLGGHFERRARREELLLNKAMEIAKSRIGVRRFPEEADLLLETERTVEALASVVARKGIPASELVRILPDLEIRRLRRERLEATGGRDGLVPDKQIRDAVLRSLSIELDHRRVGRQEWRKATAKHRSKVWSRADEEAFKKSEEAALKEANEKARRGDYEREWKERTGRNGPEADDDETVERREDPKE